MNLLLVEDNGAVGRAIAKSLRAQGHTVTLVNSYADARAASGYFDVGVLDTFGLAQVLAEANAIVLADKFDRMALDRALANLMRAQRDLTGDVLAEGKGDVTKRLATWKERHATPIARVADAVRGLTEGEMTVSRLSVAAGLLGDLARGS